MFAMVVEHLVSATAIVPYSERSWFKKHQAPLPNWQFWIGRYTRGKWSGHAIRNVLGFVPEGGFTERERDGLPLYNTQEITFTVGELYLRAFASSLPRIYEPWVVPKERHEILFRIWPIENSSFRWPPRTLDDGEAALVANWTLNVARRVTGL
jgi:hypothetical protein